VLLAPHTWRACDYLDKHHPTSMRFDGDVVIPRLCWGDFAHELGEAGFTYYTMFHAPNVEGGTLQ
jgi:hypothetical protein